MEVVYTFNSFQMQIIQESPMARTIACLIIITAELMYCRRSWLCILFSTKVIGKLFSLYLGVVVVICVATTFSGSGGLLKWVTTPSNR